MIKNHGYDLLWAKIPAPEGWKPSIKMALVNGSQVALFTQAGGFIQIGWNIEHGSFPHLRKQPFDPFIEDLLFAFPELKRSCVKISALGMTSFYWMFTAATVKRGQRMVLHY